MYSEVYLKLEPLGLERVAQALRTAGHEVRLLDLQIFNHRDYARKLDIWEPRAVGFSLRGADHGGPALIPVPSAQCPVQRGDAGHESSERDVCIS